MTMPYGALVPRLPELQQVTERARGTDNHRVECVLDLDVIGAVNRFRHRVDDRDGGLKICAHYPTVGPVLKRLAKPVDLRQSSRLSVLANVQPWNVREGVDGSHGIEDPDEEEPKRRPGLARPIRPATMRCVPDAPPCLHELGAELGQYIVDALEGCGP